MMESVQKKVLYKAFGLNINSSIRLPELQLISNPNDKIDVEIEVKDLSVLWDEIVPKTENYYVKENLVLFRILNTATFCIKDGKKIIVSPNEGYR